MVATASAGQVKGLACTSDRPPALCEVSRRPGAACGTGQNDSTRIPLASQSAHKPRGKHYGDPEVAKRLGQRGGFLHVRLPLSVVYVSQGCCGLPPSWQTIPVFRQVCLYTGVSALISALMSSGRRKLTPFECACFFLGDAAGGSPTRHRPCRAISWLGLQFSRPRGVTEKEDSSTGALEYYGGSTVYRQHLKRSDTSGRSLLPLQWRGCSRVIAMPSHLPRMFVLEPGAPTPARDALQQGCAC